MFAYQVKTMRKTYIVLGANYAQAGELADGIDLEDGDSIQGIELLSEEMVLGIVEAIRRVPRTQAMSAEEVIAASEAHMKPEYKSCAAK